MKESKNPLFNLLKKNFSVIMFAFFLANNADFIQANSLQPSEENAKTGNRMTKQPTIIYTQTDEAPALATYSLLPIIQAFTATTGINVETRDISLSGRILAHFPEYLQPNQRINDALAELGELAKTPEANIIKLPNISASVPQLKAAIKELQAQGFTLPDYPEEAKNDEEKDIKSRYDKIKGSAVNPVLREGNSDRRAPAAVKAYAKVNPHSMGAWSKDSKSHVASMQSGDFFGSEQSHVTNDACEANIIFTDSKGQKTILKSGLALQAGEVIDSSVMSLDALKSFIEAEISDAKAKDVLFSLHMKATMMKVSDPIIFGQVVAVFYAKALSPFTKELATIGVDLNNGIGDLYNKIDALPQEKQDAILKAIDTVYAEQPDLAMVDSDRGITNLHVPSDIIIDASMPAMIRSSGQMWNKDGQLQDTKAVIPDRSYAAVYEETIKFCKSNGAFDPTTMGSVANVGLMAQKAEEYGSHDKTFQAPDAGTISVEVGTQQSVMEHSVAKGDIFRMCQTKDAPIRDWVKLAVNRARATGNPAVFWLDANRAHDANLIAKVNAYLKEHNTEGLELPILAPREATQFSLDRVKAGHDTISVTGNVLRDYLTDLFPILELGTSAKMLSIVPLMNGGGLFETGAGGSAPKHVQQFEKENHLRWDSLGEFLALAVSLEHLGQQFNNTEALILAKTLDEATATLLKQQQSPSRKVNELDNRGSHFCLAKHWAKALTEQTESLTMATTFKAFSEFCEQQGEKIIKALNATQGNSIDIGGYYKPSDTKASDAMRPIDELNKALSLIH